MCLWITMLKRQILAQLVWARGRNSAFLTSQGCWSVDHTWSIKEVFFLECLVSLFESVNMVFVLFQHFLTLAGSIHPRIQSLLLFNVLKTLVWIFLDRFFSFSSAGQSCGPAFLDWGGGVLFGPTITPLPSSAFYQGFGVRGGFWKAEVSLLNFLRVYHG